MATPCTRSCRCVRVGAGEESAAAILAPAAPSLWCLQRGGYSGPFLPGYKAVVDTDPLVRVTAPIGLDYIDHVVGNQPDAGMIPIVEWCESRGVQQGAEREPAIHSSSCLLPPPI